MSASTMRSATLVVLVGILAACGGSSGPAPAEGAAGGAAAPTKKKSEVAAVKINSAVEYSYNSIGKRDPFRSMFMDSSLPTTESAESVVCSEPLCQSDLDELNLVAVISGDANPIAMLEDKSGVGHIVHRNSKIGRQGGKVTQILRDCIIVTSFISGPDGKAQPNKSNLCTRPDVRSAPVMDLLEGKYRQ